MHVQCADQLRRFIHDPEQIPRPAVTEGDRRLVLPLAADTSLLHRDPGPPPMVTWTMRASPVARGGGLVVGGPVYPLVVVTCATCGYTVFVNAIKVGIVQAEPAAAQTPQPPELANG